MENNQESSDNDSKVVETKIEDTNDVASPVPFSEAKTRSLLWKLDWNLVPFLSLLYL